MKFASWNVNSLKVRLPHLLEWLARQGPQIVCLQEIKLEDAKFPVQEIESAGYHCVWFGQRTYNGVAILSRAILADVVTGMPGFPDEQKRVIAATVGKDADAIRIVCAYVPNGQAVDSEKYEYKLDWLAAFRRWLEGELEKTLGSRCWVTTTSRLPMRTFTIRRYGKVRSCAARGNGKHSGSSLLWD